MVELNRAVAVAEAAGPEAGLRLLEDLNLDHYRYFHSARAELLRRAGHTAEARVAYVRAIDLAQTDAERHALEQRLDCSCPQIGDITGPTVSVRALTVRHIGDRRHNGQPHRREHNVRHVYIQSAPTVHRHPGATLAIASFAAFMTSIDMMVMTTAIPALRRSLAANVGDLEWTVNAYLLAFACLLLTAAGLGDRFGRRRVFSTGLAGFGACSAVAALAPSIGILIAAAPRRAPRQPSCCR